MAGLIDSLIVELGLDPSKMSAESKRALGDLANLKNRGVGYSKDVEQAYKKISDGLESVGRKTLGFLTLLIGGVSLGAFTKNLVETDKALGNLSITTGESAAELSKWRQSFQRMGGSAEGITNLVDGLQHEMNAMEIGGSMQSSSLISVLNALNLFGAKYGVNIQPRDPSGKWKKSTQVLMEIYDAIPLMNASRSSIMGQLRQLPGMDETTLAVMMDRTKDFKKFLQDQEKIGTTSEANVKVSQELTNSWYGMTQAAESLGRNILNSLAPALETVFNGITKTLKAMDIHSHYMTKSWEERDRDNRAKAGIPAYTSPGAGQSSLPAPGKSTETAQQPETRTTGDKTSDAGSGSVSPPPDVLAKAENLLRNGGSTGELQRFMASQGYPKSGNWCGEFAAAVVKSGGGEPPKGAAIASNWRKWGRHADVPQAGDIASRLGTPIGQTGGHVGFVHKVYPDGSVDILGGNQGRTISHYPPGRFEYRRGLSLDTSFKDTTPLPFMPQGVFGSMSVNRNISIRRDNQIKTDVGSMTVNSQAADAPGIAGDIMDALKKAGAEQSTPAGQ